MPRELSEEKGGDMNRRFLFLLGVIIAGLLLLTGCTSFFVNPTVETPKLSPSPTGRYLVVFKDHYIPSSAEVALKGMGATVVERLDKIGVVVVESDDPNFPNKAMGIPEVAAVGHDRMVKLSPPLEPKPLEVQPQGVSDNDLYVDYQWDIKRVGGTEETWNIEKGDGVTVAVIDTGVYHSDTDPHPDIQPNFAYAKNYLIPSLLPPGWTPVYGDDNDHYGHGTHVAGTIAAPITSGHIIGLAPEAKIASYKALGVLEDPDHNLCVAGFDSDILPAVMDAADDGCKVINMSIGGYTDFRDPEDFAAYLAWARATQYAWEHGTLVVAAAGNNTMNASKDPNRHTPSTAPAALAVVATGPTDELASYSNYGAFNADFTAPGGDFQNYPNPGWWLDMCLSAWSPITIDPALSGAYYVWAAGTSMATPKVSGIAALIYAHNPGIGPSEVVQLLKRSAEDLGEVGFDLIYGWGMPNAYRAVTQ